MVRATNDVGTSTRSASAISRARPVTRLASTAIDVIPADRATLSNMCPEYGATASYFPVDDEAIRYLRFTGRGDAADLAERYAKEQGLFRRDGDPDPDHDRDRRFCIT